MNNPNRYDGTLPCVFVSYAHRDADAAAPIIAALQEKGVRVWFESVCEPYFTQALDRRSHIRQCAVFLPVITPHYPASAKCRDALSMACRHGKPRILICTGTNALPDHVSACCSDSPVLRPDDHPTLAQFCEKLLSLPELAPAYGQPSVLPDGTSWHADALDYLEVSMSMSSLIPPDHLFSLDGGRHYVLRSPDGKVKLTISQWSATIGRKAGLRSYFVNAPFIAPQHAAFRVDDGDLYLLHLSKSNGTFVNDVPVTESPVLLNEGDRLAFGRPGRHPLIVCIE